MIDWNALTLFLYIIMRMSGFILFSPLFGRSNVTSMFKTGWILLLSCSAYTAYDGTVQIPANLLEFAVRLLLELGMGFLVAIILHLFFYIPEQAGDIVDTQMGMSMARTYDAGFQSSLTTTSNLLNILMVLLFFAANGHLTLLRLMITSGKIVPYGAVALGEAAADRVVELFVECTILGLKMSMPILAAELLGQVGMGILMKVIPQINVFAINIELKVLVGLTMLLLLMSPFSDFLLEVESKMLVELQQALSLAG